MEEWIDENGKEVQIAQFIPQIYFDEESTRLGNKYDLWIPPTHIGGLGRSENESAASTLNDLYHMIRRTIGIETERLDEITQDHSVYSGFERSWTYSHLASKGLLRTKKIKGIKVLFPTEELIKRAFPLRK